MAGSDWLSGCLEFMCLPLYQFNCLPLWLVVSGPLPFTAIHLPPRLAGGVRLSGCLDFICPPL